VQRTERAHPTVLADETKKRHGGASIARPHSCPPILYASKFAESLKLPTYTMDVLLGGICIFRCYRAASIELLNMGFVVLWHELRLLLCPLAKGVVPRDEAVKIV